MTHIHGHGCVPNNDVSISTDTEDLVGEAAEMMDMAADSKLMIFSPTKKVLQAWRHPGTNPSYDSESVCTEPTVDTNDSLDCTNEDDIILFLFPELFACVSDLESELDTSMDDVFRLDSDCSCPLVPAFPLECHMIFYDTVGCIVNPLPLEDLPIVGHSDKNTKVMMHGDEDIGVDGLKEIDPGPSTDHNIHIDGIMEHGPSDIHYDLVPLLPVASNHVISAFQCGHQAFPLVKAKMTNGNTYGNTYHFLPIIRRQNHLIMGGT
jgi:hypothetical protein